MFVGADQGAVPGFNAAFQSNPNANRVITALTTTGATILYGVQPTPRQCGASGLPGGTIFAFLSEPDMIQAGLISLAPNQRHMLVMKPNDGTPCLYSTAARQTGGGGGTGGGAGPVVPPTTGGDGGADATAAPTGDVMPPAVGGGGGGGGAVDATTSEEPSATDGGSTGVGGGGVVTPGGGVSPDSTDEPTDVSGAGGDLSGTPETSAEASPEDDGSVCFPANAQVELKDGSFKTMEQLALNDEVLAANGQHSEVFMFTHKMKNAMYKFVMITTEEGSLTATAGHYIYVNDKLTAMKSVNVGDSLTRRDGSVSIVSKVESVLARGLFNPQTLHGDIYVNGFKASTYTTAVKPSFAHSILAPFRALHRLGMNPLAATFSEGSDLLARFAPKGAAVY